VETPGRKVTDALPDLLGDYSPIKGVSDELMDPQGAVRPVWRHFVDQLARLTRDDVARRFARGDQYLRDAGVFFRQYDQGGSAERAWPLSHVPVLIEEAEWSAIAAGLRQRADLLERVAADLYGENRLVSEGYLPPAIVAGSPEWLRPLVGVRPRSGHWLHFVAFEVGRGPDGQWWVLGDRTQAPSGAGFALENRVATSRVFPELFAASNVHRLAGFFRSFRDALVGLCEGSESSVAILTPGPHNETYFEHAYIARYLGMMLVEGEDLTVEGGRLMVRTVEGLRPISVLWRRLDAGYADPLELDAGSRLGTPGLVGAVRRESTTVVNALGAGVLETRALLAFLPRIAEALLGQPLALPNIATWWCGQAAERAHVARHAEHMVIGRALATGLAFEPDETLVSGARFRSAARESIAALLEADGVELVGQEQVTLSTTPVYREGRLVPRPMSLRVFLARTPGGWEIMPGGFARIGSSNDAAAIAMQRGGTAADVWIVSPTPVAKVSMLPTPAASYVRAAPGVLPARAADNLFWLGRYVERAEESMRVLRAYHFRLSESGDASTELLVHLRGLFDLFGLDYEQNLPDGLLDALAGAVRSAGHVRDRFSPDGWMALSDLNKTARRMAATLTAGDDAARAMSVLLRKVTGFSGLVHDNMYRFTGWRFLELGRFLERAIAMTGNLAVLADPEAPEGSLDLAVEIGDSVMSHRRRYAIATSRETVVDLLALDAMNPRSVLFQLAGLRDQVHLLPDAELNGQMSGLSRSVLRVHAALAVEEPRTLDTEAFWNLRSELGNLSDLLTEAYLR
jgi:uncharacterized circularly permuted ATP-grasp superfamily protein/uncharacterized alpha-E superfamily protein